MFGFTDADLELENCSSDCKSYTEYHFILSDSTITKESSKQCTVVISSTEAEYMSLSDATKESIDCWKVLSQLWDDSIKKVGILTDNRESITLAENPVFHKRTKYKDIKVTL